MADLFDPNPLARDPQDTEAFKLGASRIRALKDVLQTLLSKIFADNTGTWNTNAIPGSAIQDHSITNQQITAGTITSTELSAATLLTIVAPTGSVTMWAGPVGTLPSGWAECDGSSQLRADPVYAALYAAVGTSWGSADVTHFNLPDLRGEFVRGFDHGRGVDTARAQYTTQADAVKDHAHNAGSGVSFACGSAGGGFNVTTGGPGIQFDSQTSTINGGDGGATETRPKNVALVYIIKL